MPISEEGPIQNLDLTPIRSGSKQSKYSQTVTSWGTWGWNMNIE